MLLRYTLQKFGRFWGIPAKQKEFQFKTEQWLTESVGRILNRPSPPSLLYNDFLHLNNLFHLLCLTYFSEVFIKVFTLFCLAKKRTIGRWQTKWWIINSTANECWYCIMLIMYNVSFIIIMLIMLIIIYRLTACIVISMNRILQKCVFRILVSQNQYSTAGPFHL